MAISRIAARNLWIIREVGQHVDGVQAGMLIRFARNCVDEQAGGTFAVQAGVVQHLPQRGAIARVPRGSDRIERSLQEIPMPGWSTSCSKGWVMALCPGSSATPRAYLMARMMMDAGRDPPKR
jgi:hypothetical protein